MNISAFADRCGLKLLILLVCYILTGINSPSAAVHIVSAAAAAMCADGALRALLPPYAPPSGVKPKITLRALAREFFTRKNAGRFMLTALLLASLALLLPFSAVYIVSAVVCAAFAVVCFARSE